MRSYIRPVVEVLNLWPRWRFAHRGPIVVPASRARAAIGLMRCRFDRWAICRVRSLSISKRKSYGFESGRRYGYEGDVIVPDGPHDSSEFVRDGDCCLVVAAPCLHGERPVMES